MQQDGLLATHEWLRNPLNAPVGSPLVPGASEPELKALTGLGGIASYLLRHGTLTGTDPVLPRAVQAWVANAPELPSELHQEVEARFRAGPDNYLADLYARLVHPKNRRRLGTFFTPTPEVSLMLEMWDRISEPPTSVIDVGAGVGVFTAAAARRWPTSNIQAVDINPVTLGLLAARLYGPGETFKNVRLVHDDFTSWIYSDDAKSSGPRLILGNPPYTRAQLLPVAERRRLQALTAGLCGSRASLSTIITAISLRVLDEQDGLCLLLPAQWLESAYAAELRRTMWSSSRRRVELRLVASDLFEDAQVDAVALLIGPEDAAPGFFVSTWQARGSASATPINTDRELSNWRPLFARNPDGQQQHPAVSTSTPGQANSHLGPVRTRTLSDFAVVKRGIATGANQYFTIDENTRREYRIATWTRRRVITRLRYTETTLAPDGDQPTFARRWLLEATREQVENHPRLAAYIAQGEDERLNERLLCSRRTDWYNLRHEVFVPDLVIGPMTRSEFRFVDNQLGAAITNNCYGMTWHRYVSADDRRTILSWLRSKAGQTQLRFIARHQGDGLMKIEPKALQGLEIPVEAAASSV